MTPGGTRTDTHRTLFLINRHEVEPESAIKRPTTRCASAHLLFWHIPPSKSVTGSRLLRLSHDNIECHFFRLLCILRRHLRPAFIAQSCSWEHRVRCGQRRHIAGPPRPCYRRKKQEGLDQSGAYKSKLAVTLSSLFLKVLLNCHRTKEKHVFCCKTPTYFRSQNKESIRKFIK